MGQLLSFSLGSSLLLATMYLVYKWVLSSENYHRTNRGILWAIYLVSLMVIPLWNFLYRLGPASSSSGLEIEFGEMMMVESVVDASSTSFPWKEILVWTYLAGMMVVLVMTMVNFARLAHIIKRGNPIEMDGRKIILTEDSSIAPFSFCNIIVIPNTDFVNYGEVIFLHERSHVEMRHWIDLIFAQLVCMLQWYNPAAWLMREEMKTVHEYQADSRVISSGTNMKDYQMLLIKKAVGSRFPSLANSLNHSKLKKRITMMHNSDSTSVRRLRPLLLLPALGIALWVSQLPAVAAVISSVSSVELTNAESTDKGNDIFADSQLPLDSRPASRESIQQSPISETAVVEDAGEMDNHVVSQSDGRPEGEDDKVFHTPEKIAEFPGGMSAMYEYVKSNFNYPENETAEGRVVVSFEVRKDGSIGDVKILRSLNKTLDDEAIRVVKSFPRWTPGEMSGRPVATWYTLPFSCKPMKKEKRTESAPEGKMTPISTSVSTSTDASGKTVTSTTQVLGYTVEDGHKVHIISTTGEGLPEKTIVYVDGKLYDGDMKELSPSSIESVTIDKTDDEAPVIKIITKKK